MTGVVYRVTNKINGKVYVGQTIRKFNRRKTQHIYHATILLESYPFYNAIRKYGEENFKWDILCECNCPEDLTKAEQVFIEYYGGLNSKKNYNLRDAGSCGKQSKETIRKKRILMSGTQNPMYGKRHSKEHKRKISLSITGDKNPRFIKISLNDIVNKFKEDETITRNGLAIKLNISECTMKRKFKYFGYSGFNAFKKSLIS